MIYACEHLSDAARRTVGVRPSAPGCVECLSAGTGWVHLRICLACGHVGCCDDSPNRHAFRHHRQCGHPVVASFEPDESWGYCFVHDAFALRLPAHPHERAPVHFSPP